MERFFELYLSIHNPSIVYCGINPGKDGAGQTGIPFIDFNSLKDLIGIHKRGYERSSNFFYSIVKIFWFKEVLFKVLCDKYILYWVQKSR